MAGALLLAAAVAAATPVKDVPDGEGIRAGGQQSQPLRRVPVHAGRQTGLEDAGVIQTGQDGPDQPVEGGLIGGVNGPDQSLLGGEIVEDPAGDFPGVIEAEGKPGGNALLPAELLQTRPIPQRKNLYHVNQSFQEIVRKLWKDRLFSQAV